MFESRGIIVAPSLKTCAVAEEQGLAGADAVAGDFFTFDIQASVYPLEEEVQCALGASRLRSTHGVLRASLAWFRPGRLGRGPTSGRCAVGSVHRRAPTWSRLMKQARTISTVAESFSAAGAAAGAVTKGRIPAPSESMNCRIRLDRRLVVARSARASLQARLVPKRFLAVYRVVLLFRKRS